MRQFRLKFQLVVLDILFTRNEAFLPGSSYIIYAERKRGQKAYRKLKFSSQTFIPDDLSRVQINQGMKMRTTLRQTLTDKYLEQYQPKQMKLKIRQETKISPFDSLFRDIGCVSLDLHTLASSVSGQEYDFPLVDPEGLCDAVVRIRVAHSFVQHRTWCSWMALTCHRRRKKELSISRMADNLNIFDHLKRMKSSSSSGSSSLRVDVVAGGTDQHSEPSSGDIEPFDMLKANSSRRSVDMTTNALPCAPSSNPVAAVLVDRVRWSKPFSQSRSQHEIEGSMIDEENIYFCVYGEQQVAIADNSPMFYHSLGLSPLPQSPLPKLSEQNDVLLAASFEGNDSDEEEDEEKEDCPFGVSFYDMLDA
eukprot:gene1995-2178_t